MTATLIFFIRFYQKTISPYWGVHCRFYPTCSVYCEEAVREKGFLHGFGLFVRRFLKCHPFHPGGYDPVESGD